MDYKQQNNIIYELGLKVKDICSKEMNETKRTSWKKHNGLDKNCKPLIWICPDDDGGWIELIPDQYILCSDFDLRVLERKLRQIIFHYENFDDDFPFEPVVRFDIPGEYTGYHYANKNQNSAWGIDISANAVSKNAYKLDDYLSDKSNVEKLLNHEVDFIVNNEELLRKKRLYEDALNGTLKCEFDIPYVVLVQSLLIELVHLRSMTELMFDLYDNTEMISAVLQHMSESKVRLLDKIEGNKLLFNNHTNIYTGSGGLGYTFDNIDENNIKISDLWGFADSQELSSVSPQMFKDFALKYQSTGLNKFKYGCYGCCEPLDNKYDLIFKEIHNLRRISVSPWSNIDIAVEAINDKVIFSWKPNPTLISSSFNECEVEALIKKTAISTKECITEIILKDIRTCGNTADHIKSFLKIAKKYFC